MYNKLKINRLVLGGLVAAIICLLTMFVRIPLPLPGGAYINAGDAGIYLAALMLGGWPAALAAAAGSALADLIVGAVVYVFPTFIIKGAMALIASKLLARKKSVAAMALAFAPMGLLMTAGYFLFEFLAFDFAYAIYSVPFNLIQLVGGTALGVLLCQAALKLNLNISD